VLLWLAATTGARRGELCALRWSNVDLAADELVIVRTLIVAQLVPVPRARYPGGRGRLRRGRHRPSKRWCDGDGPLAATLLTRPSPVLGTDKQRHVVYDFQLDNVTASWVRLERLQVVATSPPGVLAGYRGDEIVPLLLVIGADQPTRTLEPGQTGFVFLDLTFPRTGSIPPYFEHRLVLTIGEGPTAEQQTMHGIGVSAAAASALYLQAGVSGCLLQSPVLR
jgi:hypothetical protein